MEIAEDKSYNIDILWKSTWLLKDDNCSWNGMMQMINCNGEYPGQSSVVFMPMIDLNPSDDTAIYSTLVWVRNHAKRYNVTPVITFDQPLWYKAYQIVMSEPKNSDLRKTVVRLGGFHTEMSFLGSIGYLMSDSGLYEILSVLYAETTVGHMLSGKAISRALRGHGLVYMALQSLIVSEVFNLQINDRKQEAKDVFEKESCESEDDTNDQFKMFDENEDRGAKMEGFTRDLSNKCPTEAAEGSSESMSSGRSTANDKILEGADTDKKSIDQQVVHQDLHLAAQLINDVIAGVISIECACEADVTKRIRAKLDEYCDKLRQQSRTARLWIQYIEMVELLREFIKAERTGNWKLHLVCLRKMLPYFAATGHSLYAKSVYLYINKMQKLPQTNPDVYEKFIKGFHVIRRSDRYWAGLPTDLVIEQMLMRSLKSVGGLTRGRGMTDAQRAIWVLSRPATAAINEAMQSFCGTTYASNDQHRESTSAVRKRDKEDTEVIIGYMSERNPFKCEADLKSITSGVVSCHSNADNAKEVGESIVAKMEGKTVCEFIFKRNDIIVRMDDKARIKIDGETVKIDPQLLFQRLVGAACRNTEEISIQELFSFELCTYPPALFETPHLMRAADKPALANVMKTKENPAKQEVGQNETCYVIDGGMLLQWVPWKSGETFSDICDSYRNFLQSKFKDITVVFDGYANSSTKDSMHNRRCSGMQGAEVRFKVCTTFRGKKSSLLTNVKNKQRFINMLSQQLNKAGINTLHADGDADLLIVQTAVRRSESKQTVLVGDDTDLLVLLCYHTPPSSKPVFFQPRSKSHKEEVSWNIHDLQRHLGDDVCKNILFIHAFLGCDSTSKPYGIGKWFGMTLFKKNKAFRDAATVFSASPDHVLKAAVVLSGEQAMISIYKGQQGQTLKSVRFQAFQEKIAKTSVYVDPKHLPPTAAASQFHSLRVYFQIQEWKGEHRLNPLEWGWEKVGDQLFPTTSDKAEAPSSILKVVRCTCQAGCKTQA